MEIDKEFLDTLQYDIAPTISECYKNKHQLNNIKIYETLHALRENNKINFYDINGRALYLYILSDTYKIKTDYYYYYMCRFIAVNNQNVIFDVSKIYVGIIYDKPTEVCRIVIETAENGYPEESQ